MVWQRFSHHGNYKWHAPTDRLHVNASRGAPLDLAEYHRRLATIAKDRGKLTKAARLFFCSPLFCAGAALLVIQQNAGLNPLNWAWFSWLGFLFFYMIFGMMVLLCWGLLVHRKRELQQRYSELESWNEIGCGV